MHINNIFNTLFIDNYEQGLRCLERSYRKVENLESAESDMVERNSHVVTISKSAARNLLHESTSITAINSNTKSLQNYDNFFSKSDSSFSFQSSSGKII